MMIYPKIISATVSMLYKRASCIEKEVTTFLIVVEVNYPQKVEATIAT